MAYVKAIPMSKVKQVIRMYMSNTPYREISSVTGLDKETVCNYIKRARQTGADLSKLLHMDDPVLEALIRGGKASYPDERFEVFKASLPYYEEELRKVGVTRKLLWEEYRRDNPDGYSLTQFNEHLRQNLKAAKSKSSYTVLTDTYEPGERIFVDFAGKKLQYVDMETGEVVKVEVFLATLPASDMGFACAVHSQTIPDFLQAMEKCIRYFGGVPKIWTPDNLKSAVVKADRYLPKINEAYDEMANHYGAVVIPARSLHPKDKGLVENQVKMAYRWVYAPLRDRIFSSLQELNQAIAEMMQKHNQKRLTGRDFSREEYFLAKEKPILQPLPETRFDISRRTTLKVQHNCCVLLSEDYHYYSVPYQYIGKSVLLTYTPTLVKIYLEGQCLATHPREQNNMTRSNMTYKKEHFPPEADAYRQRSKEYYIERADKVCQELGQLVRLMFESGRDKPEQYFYNSCDGLLHMAKKEEDLPVLKKACSIALGYHVYRYAFIKDLMSSRCGGALEDEKAASMPVPPDHLNIRGKEAFC